MLGLFRSRWNKFIEEHPRLEKVAGWLGKWLPPLNYITIHYAYFLSITLASSLIYWGSSQPFDSVDYVDSLFLVTSAITNTGLNTRNLSETTTWQQVQLWFLLMIGSPIWISFWTVLIRKHAFEKRFEDIVERERERRKQAVSLRSSIKRAPNLRSMLPFKKFNTDPTSQTIGLQGLGSKLQTTHGTLNPIREAPARVPIVESTAHRTVSAPQTMSSTTGPETDDAVSESKTIISDVPYATPAQTPGSPGDHITFAEPVSPRTLDRGSSVYGPGNRLSLNQVRRQSEATSLSSNSDNPLAHWKNFLSKRNVTRNGQFYDLSSDEREHLGGCEYRALKILSITVPLYSALCQFLGAVALASYIGTRTPEIPRADGEDPWWTGIFYSVSAFNNGGFSLVDDSVIPFQGDYFVLLVIGLLILAGNTAYPVFLRLILWSTLQTLKLTTEPEVMAPWKETLEFILKYPRRVYTTLFPARATWWLVAVLFVTNIIDWLAFEILNIGNPALTALPIGDQIMAGLFQAISVRAAGFVVIGIPSLYIGVQVLYLIMMYIAVYPVVITMRNSNVYEERSLGIYEDDPSIKEQDQEQAQAITKKDVDPGNKYSLRRRNTAAVIGKQIRRVTTFQGVGVSTKSSEDTSTTSFIGQQIKGQLAHDLWWLVLAIMVIVIIETDHFRADPVTYSVFNILFEATSAYACVGLSIGLPTQSYSLAGGLHNGSKVVLSLVMMRGRHRGLPVAIDRAVRLPGEKLHREEEEDSKIRRSRTVQRMASQDD